MERGRPMDLGERLPIHRQLRFYHRSWNCSNFRQLQQFARYGRDHHIAARAPACITCTPAEIANFSEPAAGTYGTSGRNSFRGPGFFNVDSSLVKRFAVTEHKYFTFGAEAYNLFNNVDFANPSVTLPGSKVAFGRISAVVNKPRIMQLALRFDF
jgi:hypothetical protein